MTPLEELNGRTMRRLWPAS